MNQIQQLRTRSVADLAQKSERFHIPSYQRGYRWDKEQVRALLDDLAEFENRNTDGAFYCLQPLVVVRREKVGRWNEWEVVDGQQRLTTIFLILNHLSPPESHLFHICYERHPEDKLGLAGLLQTISTETPAADFCSPDFHFIKKAQEAIQDWLKAHPGQKLASLTNLEGVCAKFIWQELDHPREAVRVFSRLNAGKIRLKDSELIRALFLRSGVQGVLNEGERLHLALRWDQMEQRLHQPEFWSFLNRRSTSATIRICSARGGSGNGIAENFSAPRWLMSTPPATFANTLFA